MQKSRERLGAVKGSIQFALFQPFFHVSSDNEIPTQPQYKAPTSCFKLHFALMGIMHGFAFTPLCFART